MKQFLSGDIVEFVGINGKDAGNILIAKVVNPTHSHEHFTGKVVHSNMGDYYQKGAVRTMSNLVFDQVEDSNVYEENILKLFQATAKLDRILKKRLKHENI